MNKQLIIPIVLSIAVLAGLGAFVMVSGNDDGVSKINTSNTDHTSKDDKHYEAVRACEIFTLQEATAILGEATEVANATLPASPQDVAFDTCSYSNNASETTQIKTATVTVRSANSKSGTDSNSAAFKAGGVANPVGAVSINNYGEKAYWISGLGQLNILEDHGHEWISIVSGGTNPSNNTLTDAKLIAEKLAN